MFKPATLREVDCTTELERGGLLVLGAPFEQILLMKLYASRGLDLDDLIALWPRPASAGTLNVGRSSRGRALMGRPSKYSSEFREQAVELARATGKPSAMELGLTPPDVTQLEVHISLVP